MKLTSQMTRLELARVFAAEKGHRGRPGGHIYDDQGRHLAHGWEAYAQRFSAFLKPGQGIDWTAANWTAAERREVGRCR